MKRVQFLGVFKQAFGHGSLPVEVFIYTALLGSLCTKMHSGSVQRERPLSTVSTPNQHTYQLIRS